MPPIADRVLSWIRGHGYARFNAVRASAAPLAPQEFGHAQ